MQTTYRRKEAISSLPGKVFDAVPTLRVLAIAEEVDQIGRRPTAAGGASATPKARHLYMEDRTEDLPGWARHLEWGTLDRARFRLHWWYRASPKDEPMRVPEKEGERAYAAILRACTTTTGEPASTADIERKYMLKSRARYCADGCLVYRASCVHVFGINKGSHRQPSCFYRVECIIWSVRLLCVLMRCTFIHSLIQGPFMLATLQCGDL